MDLRDSSFLKEGAALRALDLVCDGMWLGLGTGSTAARFVEALGVKVAAGLKVLCVPTSETTRAQAERLGIPLTTLDDTPHLHLTVDGADEIDDQLRLIKGGEPFLTDQGNFILDCAFGRIPEPEVLAFALKRVPGVVEHGLFLGVADMAIVATDSGVQILQRTPSGE